MGNWLKDFFSDEEEDLDLKERSKVYEVTRDKLLEKLGLKNKKISFIKYDYKKGVLVLVEGDYKNVY